jgi:hypothetical protein
MFNCSSCKALLPNEAKFCPECGKPVVPISSVNEDAAPIPPMAPKASKLKGVAGSLLEAILWIAMVGWFAALIIPALAPERPAQPPASGAAGAWIGILVVAYFLAKRRGAKRPWAWVVTAAASVFLIYFTGGYLHARGRRQALDADLMTSITSFDPGAGAKLQGLKDNAPEFEKVFQPVLARAIQIAPDQPVIDLSLAQQSILAPTGTDISRCVAAATGTAISTTGISNELQRDVAKAETELLRAAASSPRTPSAPDVNEVRTLVTPLYAQIDPNGVLEDRSKFAKLPPKEQCQMYLDLMKGIDALPSADAATVLRYFIGARLVQ